VSPPRRSPLVTVIIPVYNRVAYLGATIESVLGQTWADWELIVVDDGSQEDVTGFLARYTDPRITLICQDNQGNAVARNTGIAQARGRYLICLDSDDIWLPRMLETCVAILEANPDVDVAFVQWQKINATGLLLPKGPEPEPRCGDLLESLLLGYPILPSAALARARCFHEWGAYTPGLDDWELWMRWAVQGCRFLCVAQPLLHYRIHPENLNLNWSRRRQTHFAMLDALYARTDLPAVAHAVRDRAYAHQYAHFAELAWLVGHPAEAVSDFIQAVRLYPAYLDDLDFLTRIACAQEGRLDAGPLDILDLDRAEQTLLYSLNGLFTPFPGPADLSSIVCRRRAAAYGRAYLVLARLAYSLNHDMVATRRFLCRSLAAWPAVVGHSDWIRWLARAWIGWTRIQTWKMAVPFGRL
jgi:glycosyltransferase involved in cell wall biosynthesis